MTSLFSILFFFRLFLWRHCLVVTEHDLVIVIIIIIIVVVVVDGLVIFL